MNKMISLMRDYQKMHNIKGQCGTNSMYLVDNLRNFGFNAKVQPVIVVSTSSDSIVVNSGHLVVIYNNVLLEPSYEIYSLKTKHYCFNVKEFIDLVKQYKLENIITNDKTKEFIKNYLSFCNLAKQINEGEFLIADRKFYDDQADYVEKYM
jgi:hypothetical protein